MAAARSRPKVAGWPLEDHDLLIRIDTKLEALTKKVDEIGASKASDSDLKDVKAKVEAQDKRLKLVERLSYIAIGAILFLELALKLWPLFH